MDRRQVLLGWLVVKSSSGRIVAIGDLNGAYDALLEILIGTVPVDSAVLRIIPRSDPAILPDEEPAFRTFVVGAFGFRRKQMRRVLRELWNLDAERADELLATARVDPEVRPETLSAVDFAKLLRARMSS